MLYLTAVKERRKNYRTKYEKGVIKTPCCCCLHIKKRSDLYPVPFSFLLFKVKKRISVGHKLTQNKVQTLHIIYCTVVVY